MFSLAEFTSRDGVAETDRARYNQLTASFEADLRPTGGLEICLAAEVLRSTWRIQRYAAVDDTSLPDDAARLELARARAAAAKSLRWGMSELRNLQTNREIQQKLGIHLPGIADIRQILKFTGTQPRTVPPLAAAPANHRHSQANSTRRTQSEQGANVESLILARLAAVQSKEQSIRGGDLAEITERTQFTPRGGPCPCGSGEKYKRCCGKDAPPVPGDWLNTLKSAA